MQTIIKSALGKLGTCVAGIFMLCRHVARMTTVFWLMSVTTAASADEMTGSSTLPAVIGSDEVLNMAGSLLLIVGAIFVVGWLYTRVKGRQGHSGGFIQILATQPLGAKERVLLVEVANQQLLLGVTATRIQTLYVLEQPIESATPARAATGFAERLRTAISGVQK